MHRHGSVQVVCETYGTQVLGITPEDRCLSAAKAFFAYGLGNSLLFPMSAGAAAVLEPSPARPEIMAERAGKYAATLFFAGPTFFSNMLRAGLPADALAGVRLAASAGEALPAALYQRWTSHFGVDILDGIGMTEMLHIFLSNRPGQVKAGTTGVAVPGYDLRVLGEDGLEVPPGIPGTLFVRGASAATGYWSRYDASRQVFQGEWLRTGDTYVVDADGYYSCLGRTGDMLKASGIWVSPAEVEARLLAHDDVAQAVVVAANDTDGLEKPVAFVLLSPGAIGDEDALIDFCRAGLPSFKRPRRIVFVTEYPTTSTGKIRRVELRVQAASIMQGAGLPGDPRRDAGPRRSPWSGPAPWAPVSRRSRPWPATRSSCTTPPRAPPRGRSPRSATGSPGWCRRAGWRAPVDLRLEVAGELGELARAAVRDRGGGRGPGRQAGPVRRPGEGRRAGLRAGHEHLLAVADRHRGRAQPPRDAWWACISSTRRR